MSEKRKKVVLSIQEKLELTKNLKMVRRKSN